MKRRADKLNAVEKQLVELAFALADKPALLVLDEPTAALPQHEAEQLLASVRTYAENGGAVLFVSHRLEEVFSLADRIAVLRDGERVWHRPCGGNRPHHTRCHHGRSPRLHGSTTEAEGARR